MVISFLSRSYWLSIEKKKQKTVKQIEPATLQLSKLSGFFDPCNTMDAEALSNLASERNPYIYVFVDHFSNSTVTVPTPRNNAHYRINSLLHHWISNLGAFQYLLTDRRTNKFEIASCYYLSHFRPSPRTSHAPWTIGLIEVQKNCGTSW